MAAILEVSGLKKAYKNFELKNVSFSIHEDCITGFIGVNGAGKTTTINALLNLIHRDGGIVKFRGKDISTDEKTFKDKIGVVFDSGCFYDELTIKDMTALLAPAYSEWDDHIYKQYLERFSLQQEQTIGTLSKGMKMKYALALALSHNAELLIMDEPTSGLDPLMREQFINILKSYIEPGGRAVFYSTHNTTDLDKSADMLIMINAGKILFEEEKDLLLEKFRVVKGDVKYLSPDIKSLMLHFEKSKYGFTGISDNASKIKSLYPDVLFERASIEDIMLAYVKEGE